MLSLVLVVALHQESVIRYDVSMRHMIQESQDAQGCMPTVYSLGKIDRSSVVLMSIIHFGSSRVTSVITDPEPAITHFLSTC